MRHAMPLVIVLLAGCSLVQAPYEDERDRLARAEARWRSQGWDDYELVMSRLCFCPYGGAPVRVTVRDGQRVGAVLVETGETLPEDVARWYFTVDEQFEFLRDALGRDPAEFRATYDDAAGWPQHAWVDYATNIADEEQGFDNSQLTPHRD